MCRTPVNQEAAECHDADLGIDVSVSATDEYTLAPDSMCATNEGCFKCTGGVWTATECLQGLYVLHC